MKRLLASSCVVLLVVVLGTFAHGQNPIPSSENARHQLAIDLLRSINTAELDYKLRHTGYADWKTLVTNAYFTSSGTKWAPKDSPLAKLQFSKSSEILPEWSLRLNVSADAKAYDLLLEDLKDDKCGYAAITDDRGVIRQAKSIDCKM